MNIDQKNDYFRDLLLARREDLVRSARMHHRFLDDTVTLERRDAADEATTTVEQELTTSITVNEDHLFRKIENALQKLDEGTYGVCEDCGKAIPHERLEARPEVTLCVTCQSRAEQSQRTSPPSRTFVSPDFPDWSVLRQTRPTLETVLEGA